MRFSIILALMLLAILAHGQISVTTNQKPKTAPYDSMVNWPVKTPAILVGQELFVPGKQTIRRNNGYEGFYTKPAKDKYYYQSKQVYKCCKGAGSIYDSIVGKYFTVLQLMPPRNPDSPIPHLEDQCLMLQEKASGDTVYYEFIESSSNDFTFPFVTLGHYQKLEQVYKGKTFYLKGKSWIGASAKIVDINTGDKLDIAPGSKWTCTGVTVESDYYMLSLILENAEGRKVAYFTEKINNPAYSLTQEDVEYLTKKYSAKIAASAIIGKPQIGSNEEIVTYALGKPSRVSELPNGQILWDYLGKGNYYFASGILVAVEPY